MRQPIRLWRGLAPRGVRAAIVSQRLNRRKIDVIPEPEWADPPKAKISELLAAVEGRIAKRRPRWAARGRSRSPRKPRATPACRPEGHERCEARRDRTDRQGRFGALDLRRALAPRDRRRRRCWSRATSSARSAGYPAATRCCSRPRPHAQSPSPSGVSRPASRAAWLTLGGGPESFLALLNDQLERRRRGDLPEPDGDEAWTISVRGFDPELERVHSSLLTISDGVIGTSGSPVGSHPSARPRVLAAGLYDGEGPDTDLIACPVWTRLDGELPHATAFERQVDLHAGLVRQRLGRHPDLDSICSPRWRPWHGGAARQRHSRAARVGPAHRGCRRNAGRDGDGGRNDVDAAASRRRRPRGRGQRVPRGRSARPVCGLRCRSESRYLI